MVKIQAFLALEASLATRLSTTASALLKPLMQALDAAIDAEDWEGAERLVGDIDLSDAYALNVGYVDYVSKLAMLFGASRVTRRPGTSAVALGFDDETRELANESFRRMVEEGLTEYLKAQALQLIALKKPTPPELSESLFANVFKDSEASKKAWLTRRRNAEKAKAGDWNVSFSEDLSDLDAGIKAEITGAMHELVAVYPQLKNIRVVADDTLTHSGSLASKSIDSLRLNKDLWNPEYLKTYAKEWDGCLIDASPRGVTIHEMGHVLDNQVLNKLGSKKYNALVSKFTDPENYETYSTTPYGMENHAEFMAESFTAYFLKKGANGAHPDTTKRVLSTADAIWSLMDKHLKP